MTRPRMVPLGLMAAVVAGAALPAAAVADSIVYIRDNNVWVANPDGTGQHQVTTDGTSGTPYVSPTQADDGTIAAGHGDDIVRLRQNGTVVGRFDPPGLTNSVSYLVDRAPSKVAVSPDGQRVAWSYAEYSCPIGVGCRTRTVTGVTSADGTTPPQQLGVSYLYGPSWVGNNRILVFGGYLQQVNVQDLGSQPTHWFDDQDVVGQADSTDLGDGELSPNGAYLAAIRGYGSTSRVIWYQVQGNATSGAVPAAPTPLCETGRLDGLKGPTWSPDSTALAWEEPDGVWVKRGAADCTVQPALAIPGGREPDWGPADVAPEPRPTPDVTDPQPAVGTPNQGGAGPVTVTASRARLGVVLRTGVRLRVGVPSPGRVRVVLRRGRVVVGSRTVTVTRAGVTTVTVRPTLAARRAIVRARSVTLRVTVTHTAGATVTTTAVTLRSRR